MLSMFAGKLVRFLMSNSMLLSLIREANLKHKKRLIKGALQNEIKKLMHKRG